MNVWIRKTRRQGTCQYCSQPILKDEYQVVTQWYVKLRSGRTWQKRRIYHPQCWIDQAVAEIERRPVVETRGGWGSSRIKLADDVKAARTKILMRRASVLQRIKVEVSKPTEEQSVDKIIHLGDLLNKLKEEIEEYGGVPKSWL